MELQRIQKFHVIGNDSWKGFDDSAIFSLLDIVLDEYFYHTAGGACIGYDSRLHLYSFHRYVIISMATIMNDNTVHAHVRNQYVHVNGYLGVLIETKTLEHFCLVKHCALLMYFNLGLTLTYNLSIDSPQLGNNGCLCWCSKGSAGAGGTAGAPAGGTTGTPAGGTAEAPPGGTTGAPPRGTPRAAPGWTTGAPPRRTGEAPYRGIAGAPPGGIAEAPPGGISGAPPGGIAGAPPGGIAGAPPGGIAGAPVGGIAGSPPGGRMGSSSLLSGSGLGDLLIL
uniref:Uncharacterized protein n=1 Tax=Amphimedon queenslandica TaxID=400682 RepID=A0A1X7VMA0_AMPQE